MCVYMGNTAELLILIHSTTTTRKANIINSAHFFTFHHLCRKLINKVSSHALTLRLCMYIQASSIDTQML